MLKLYDYPDCPFCQKVRVVLAEKDLEYEKIFVDLRRQEQKTPEFLRMNPYGKVPVLIDEDEVIYDSTIINEYLEDEYPLPHLLPGDSQANRRYLYFARRADIEGYPDVGGLFRDTSEAETGHAFGHLDFLKEAGDPVTGLPIGSTEQNLKSAIDGETYEFTEMYPGFAKAARGEGFEEIAERFETLAKAEKSHAGRFTKGLQTLGQ